jgi:hypothetical protein
MMDIRGAKPEFLWRRMLVAGMARHYMQIRQNHPAVPSVSLISEQKKRHKSLLHLYIFSWLKMVIV